MKIAIYNPFWGKFVAESELSRRIYLAAINLGWAAVEVSSSVEVKRFNPDIIFALHFRIPKLAGYPTYGCMWNPPVFFEQEEIFIRNILSYDGYLSSSSQVNLWLEDILYNTAKNFVIVPFYTSCNQTSYQAPNIKNPHIAYVGSNWDGSRFKELFLKLDQENYMEVYGDENGWQYLTSSYKGSLPFDGISVVKTLNQAGVGLCLHREEHCKAQIPSMRIFEIAASGAVAVCNEHPFIKENFGDSVLYLSSDPTPDERVQEISEHLQWIRENQEEALEMSRKAHRIFTEKFSLEKLLSGLLPYHKQLTDKKGFTTPQQSNTNLIKQKCKPVQIIIRVGGRNISKIKRALDSIAEQTYLNIGIIIVKWKEVEGLEILLKEYVQRLSIKVVDNIGSSCRSTSLWKGINEVSSEYFGILDDDDLIHCNHINSLVSLLEQHEDYGVAYSGAIRVWEPDHDGESLQIDCQQVTEPGSLVYFRDFELSELVNFRNFITTNSFVARTALIDGNIRKDPQLNLLEDFFLILNLSKITCFIFSYEVTCEFYFRASKQDNSVFENKQKWDEVAERIEKIMRNQEFPHKQTLGQFRAMQAELERLQIQLQTTQAEIAHTHAQLTATRSQIESQQAEIAHTHQQLAETTAALDDTKTHLQITQTDLENTQTQLQATQTELKHSYQQQEETEAELEIAKTQLQIQQAKIETSQTQLHHTQIELMQAQTMITAMESSKFWKLRSAWFKLKQAFGITDKSSPTISTPDVVAIPGVNSVAEIKFKSANKKYISGCFDGINGSNTTIIEVPNTNLISASGWAILLQEGRAADQVLITCGKKNSLITVAAVNLERQDVVRAFNNPAYKNSGWNVVFNVPNLPAGKHTLKAWAYNAERKEAIQLNNPTSSLKITNLFPKLKYYYAVVKVKGTRYALAKVAKKIYHKLDKSPATIEVVPVATSSDESYAKWLSNNFPREADLRKMADTLDVLAYKPVISIVMPVYNPPEQYLQAAIESVLKQVYPYWELCIADDASTKPYVKTILEEYAAKDARIKVVYRTENGHISRASNSAIEIATGEFICLLDHDDLLTLDALYEVALLLNRHPDADMIYSDEDKIDEYNQLKEPFFKPDWCPDSFLSRMYTCHLGTYRRKIVNEIGGFRAGFEGSQDYDFVLRFTEKTDKIFHIPKVLYHWRIHAASTASSLTSKNYATDAAKKTLAEAISRRGEAGIVLPAPRTSDYYIVRYKIETHDLVSIIIPTKNLGAVVDKCLQSIFELSTYPNYEVILIDNGSTEKTAFDVFDKWQEKEPQRFKCYPYNIPFNFSKINNFAVEKAQGKYLLFLNNDTEVITPDWIEAMVEQAQRQPIAAVGALLLYPDDTIQHAGVVAGIGGVAGHSHKHFPLGSQGYFSHINTVNNYSAVTAACMMCRRDVFEEVGGFEEELTVAFNDIDLCFKFLEKGYRNVYLPHVLLYHYESKSRGYENTPEKLARFIKEIDYMQARWKHIIAYDPCYNPHLTNKHENYSINI